MAFHKHCCRNPPTLADAGGECSVLSLPDKELSARALGSHPKPRGILVKSTAASSDARPHRLLPGGILEVVTLLSQEGLVWASWHPLWMWGTQFFARDVDLTTN